ncbi:D-lyxose/D-mannose family sugar isomerase [Anaerocolumna sedimenticola]|uniref:D-lyxose ketol-isomerase n=1 Tax=Anaerocolumna sedimenticola TaxID=2696063 RepID=A0A6P1TRK5_9FIRM|nr:D-lyxose/D-mannose family sugar isomerase [Anaerocolumna sedimenticola]QHQ62376.1 D-lyxose/D-mannose family sugar isomerase [Anaerocolumna sedimenticola]
MEKDLYTLAKDKALEYFEKAHIVLTEKEKNEVEVADFGLGDLYQTGLESVVYINTDNCCAKEMVLFPYQTCPEHIHPPIGDHYPGKEETFRVRMGTVYLYVEGDPVSNPKAIIPKNSEKFYTVFHEITLQAGEQYTLYPGTKHWFQAGSEGAVVSEFSTHCYDEYDIFTNPAIKRIPDIIN